MLAHQDHLRQLLVDDIGLGIDALLVLWIALLKRILLVDLLYKAGRFGTDLWNRKHENRAILACTEQVFAVGRGRNFGDFAWVSLDLLNRVSLELLPVYV